MSIATVGPAKYDFQDLVCIKFALQFYKKKTASLIVEGDGAEDAELAFQTNENSVVYEIQVKGSMQHYGMPLIAECLGHFPAHQSTDFFLQRIIDNPDRYAVLVMSGRADDTLQKYIPRGDWQGEAQTTVTFTQLDAESLENAILSYAEKFSDSTLQSSRRDYIKKYFETINWKTVRDALQRIIVLDSVVEKGLVEDCRHVLRKDFYIPDDYFEAKLDGLRTEIKAGRQSKVDIMPDVIRRLRENPIQSVRPSPYALRGDEVALSEGLQQKNVLLLSGKPRVGKSNTARWIAADLQDKGYRVLNTQDVDVAERFILDPDRGLRLVLIDDPLGGTHAVNNQNDKWLMLRRIINNVSPGRKVIIAQGQERLFEFCRVQQLSRASLSGHCWTDLSHAPDSFLLHCWALYENELPRTFYQTVRRFIQEGQLNIEPGCLSYLALTYDEFDALGSPEDIIRFARKDAADLGRGLENEGYKDLLLGLAVATSHLENIHDAELAHVLTNEAQSTYGLSKSLGTGSSFSLPAKEQELNFPDYEPYPQLGTHIEKGLERLDARQIIHSDEHDGTNFSHPFYRAAAESLFEYAGRRGFREIEHALRNGIFCLSPSTARACAGNLYWVYNRTDSKTNKDELIRLAIEGLDSSYPSVRDICFDFLIHLTPILSADYQKEIPSWAYKVSSDRSSALRWVNGQPWYPMGMGLILNSGFYHEYDTQYVENLLNQMAQGKNVILTSKDAYDILSHFRQDPAKLNHELMTKLLSVNEGFIRALAAKLWMIQNRVDDEDIFERIFRDKHPAVAEAVFQSAVRAWWFYPQERQQRVIDTLAEISTQPVLANAIIGILVIFERAHATGDNPPWAVFSRLFPIALSSLPVATHINFARLANVVDEACSKLSAAEMLNILSSWVSFLENNTNYNDSFALNVTETLLKTDISMELETQRLDIIQRLLSLNGTGERMRILQDICYHWSILSDKEKSEVVDHVVDNRSDRSWIWASLILTHDCPAVLLKHIVHDYDGKPLTVNILMSLEPVLFEAVFLTATANTYTSLYHMNSGLRYDLVKSIAKDIKNPLSPLAIEYIIIFFEEEKESFLCDLVHSSDQGGISLLFNIILYFYADSNPSYMRVVWLALFDRATKEVIEREWIPKLIEYSGKIFRSLHPDEIREFVPQEWMDTFYHALPDMSFYKYMSAVFNSELCEQASDEIHISTNIRALFYKDICKLHAENPPVHRNTYEYIISKLSKSGFTSDELTVFEEALERLHECKKYEPPFSNYELVNWQY